MHNSLILVFHICNGQQICSLLFTSLPHANTDLASIFLTYQGFHVWIFIRSEVLKVIKLCTGVWQVSGNISKEHTVSHYITSADSNNFFWELVSSFQKTQCCNTGNQNMSWVEADKSLLLWLGLIWHKSVDPTSISCTLLQLLAMSLRSF